MEDGSEDESRQHGRVYRSLSAAGRKVADGARTAFNWARRTDPRTRKYVFANLVLLGGGVLLLFVGGSDDTVNNIAASLFAAGITGAVFLLYQTLAYQDDQRAKQLHKVGLEAVYRDRAQAKEEYPGHLSDARKSIDILAFGLKNFREDFDSVENWWNGRPEVRILLISPTFPGDGHSYATQRGLEENENNGGQIAADVESFARYLRRKLGPPSQETGKSLAQWKDPKHGSFLQLKLAQCIPAITVFRIDDVAYWGPYLIERASRQSPTIKVRSARPLFEAIERHFDSIWQRWSEDIPPEWLDEPRRGGRQ